MLSLKGVTMLSRSFVLLCAALLLLQGSPVLTAAEKKAPPKVEGKKEKRPPPAKEASKEPPLRRLMELNARELFGGDAQVKGDRVTIRFPGKGSFARGFRVGKGRGKGFVSDINDLRDGSVKTQLTGGIGTAFSCAGLDGDSAMSVFEMADDFSIRFQLKIPFLAPQAQFTVRINDRDSRNYIQTNFLQDIAAMEDGKKRQARTNNQVYAGSPGKWWEARSKGTIPVQITFKDGKVTVSCGAGDLGHGQKGGGKGRGRGKEKAKDGPEVVELVSLEGFEKATGGKIRFGFQNLSLCMANLAIDGKYDRAWAESQIAKLRKEGKLKVSEPVVAGQEPGATGKKSRTSAKKKGKVNVDEPDPEGDDDL
jgi:hypothetical protein